MGGLSGCGVDPSRIASVQHTFKIPGRSAAGKLAQSMPSGAETVSEKQPAASVKGSGSDGIGSRRKAVAMVGPEPSPELRQGAAGDDEIVGSEDIEEVRVVHDGTREEAKKFVKGVLGGEGPFPWSIRNAQLTASFAFTTTPT